MKPVRLAVSALIFCGFVYWVVKPGTPPAAQPIPAANRGKAFGSYEANHINAREVHRSVALRGLDQPWGGRCAGASRKDFIDALSHYYEHRQNSTDNYSQSYGRLGANYIAQQWTSTDDRRIDRLTQEAYVKGFLKPDEFNKTARKMIATVVKDERVTGKACAG
jgi:hypothetical protein